MGCPIAKTAHVLLISVLVLTGAAAAYAAAAAERTPKELCKHDQIKDERIGKFHSQVERHPFFIAARKRSPLMKCANLKLGFDLQFKIGDRIEYTLSDVAPSVEYLFAKPWPEKEAFELARSALKEANGKPCALKMESPSESRGDTKVYWCEDTHAISVTLNADKRALRIRRWTVH